jgi:hypothetical protein
MACDQKYWYLAADVSDSRLDHPGKDWAWQGDYLSIHASPVRARQGRTDPSSAIFIYPYGGGATGQQPYAVRRSGPQGDQELAIRLQRRFRPGGYTVEARLPITAILGFNGNAGASWHIKLIYHNVNGIYQTYWDGLVTLPHARKSSHCTG